MEYQTIIYEAKDRIAWITFNRPEAMNAMRWLHENKEPAIDFLSKEMKLKPEQARRGWEYYTENKIWNPNAESNIDGIRTVIQISAERGLFKGGALPPPTKYVDHSYVDDALKEIGRRQ